MEWLSTIKKAPLPKSIEKFDSQLHDLINNWLLVCDQPKRKTCAQSLQNAFIGAASYNQEEEKSALPTEGKDVIRTIRNRMEDDSTLAPLFKGTLWKMNTNGDMKDAGQFIKRDMWIAHNHSLCYFSVKENKRLVLLDGAKLNHAVIELLEGCARDFAFKATIKAEDETDAKDTVAVFAAESEQERKDWTMKLKEAGKLDIFVTMKLGEKMADELKEFRLAVKNRRIKIEDDSKADYEPSYKAKLWKLKAEGDIKKDDNWFLRDMWTTKNGSLAYYSAKEERDLVYYTAQDLNRCTMEKCEGGVKGYAFTVVLESADGVEFDPGTFSAESEKGREDWMKEISKYQSKK